MTLTLRQLCATAALVGVLVSSSAFAQAEPTATATTMTDDQLFKELGGKPGLVKLMEDFVPRLYADPRIGSFFKETKPKFLKDQLADQFCVVSGGGCTYDGADMKSAHSSIAITQANFNALVEDLQLAMDAQGIAFRIQNKLLAQLAPMYRMIVNAP